MCCVSNYGTEKRSLFYIFQGQNVYWHTLMHNYMASAECIHDIINCRTHLTGEGGSEAHITGSQVIFAPKKNNRQLIGLWTLQRLCQKYVTFSSYALCSGMCLFPQCFILICPFPFIIYDIEKSSKNKGFHYPANCFTNEKLVYLGGVIRCVNQHQLDPQCFNLPLGCSQRKCSHAYSRLDIAIMEDVFHNLSQDTRRGCL